MSLLPVSHKIEPRSKPCVFLSYCPSHLGYRCLDIETNRVYLARHVRFDEGKFPFRSQSILGPVPFTPPGTWITLPLPTLSPSSVPAPTAILPSSPIPTSPSTNPPNSVHSSPSISTSGHTPPSDYILVTGNVPNRVADFVTTLGKEFALRNLGGINYFFGIESVPTTDGLILSKRHCILNLITRAGLQSSKDGSTLLGFLNAWGSINKFHGEAHLLALGDKVLPFYDRSLVEDANGVDATRWDSMKNYRPTLSSTVSLPTYKVRATFTMSEADIQKLKSYVIKSLIMADHYNVSSFAVVCAYVWTCFARSAGEVLADDEAEYFTCPIDCRHRLNPPLPDTYFGNCLAIVVAELTHARLKGNEGFVAAVQARLLKRL
ncbi:hypothetical protein BUALT_Bualt02G0139800 [Buddleja alternifolia]|uniref:Retroviral polymerase SH3-like domain-containing protein n=1 Tax=Buddleja alternifolia TaxID=168488 RepID=A0AAV6Y8N8_9LAMI|nr:hypothetical protein BUALT_Bualt02G0139800 [Buddleja alternifolia]